MIKYSAKKHACYDTSLEYKILPDDLIEITAEEHSLFMGNDLPAGKRLITNKYPFKLKNIPKPTAEELAEVAEAEAQALRSENMLAGFDYNGYQISVTKDDGDALMQVKSAFDLGLTDTVIHFVNGTNMPITAAEFDTFALAFVTERNKYFAGA